MRQAGAIVVTCMLMSGCSAQVGSSSAGPKLTVEQVSAADLKGPFDSPVLLELQGVKLPDSASAMRVYVAPKGSLKLGVNSPNYVGSVSKSHPGPYGPAAESFVFEVQDVLARLKRSDLEKLEVVVQPISAQGSPVGGSAQIANVKLQPARE